MSFLQMELTSRYLYTNEKVNIFLPSPRIQEDSRPDSAIRAFYESGRKFKVLWLLHGSTESGMSWFLNANIARYAEERELIVVAPDGLNSEFLNWPDFGTGYPFWDFFAEELMPMVQNWLPASREAKDNYIGGLSMGGNSSLMTALGHPGRFGGIAILSSAAREVDYLYPAAHMTAAEFAAAAAADPVRFPGPHGDGMRTKEINAVCKYPTVQAFLDSPENAWDRLTEAFRAKTLPPIYLCYGTKDPRAPRYRRFADHLREMGVEFCCEEFEGLAHEWAVWDPAICHALDYFMKDSA